MPVYRIDLASPLAEQPRAHFVIVDTEIATVEELLVALERGPVILDQLNTQRHVEPRTFEIVGRHRLMLTLGSVLTIATPVHRYVEYDAPPQHVNCSYRSERPDGPPPGPSRSRPIVG